MTFDALTLTLEGNRGVLLFYFFSFCCSLQVLHPTAAENTTSSRVLFNLENESRLVSSLYKSARCSASCTDGQLITGKI